MLFYSQLAALKYMGRRIEEEPIISGQEVSIEDRVHSEMAELLQGVISSAQQYQTLLESEQGKVSGARSELTDKAELHKQITGQLAEVEKAAEILNITIPEEPEQIAESEPFVKSWAMLKQEVEDNERKLKELADAVARESNLDILQATLSHQINVFSSFQAQWGLNYEGFEQTKEVRPSRGKSVDTQISEVRVDVLKILQGGPQTKTHLVDRLVTEGYGRELIELAMNNFFQEDELIEGGWSTNTAAIMGRKGGAGSIFRLKTQALPETVHYFPGSTREQIVERFKQYLVEELIKQEKPLTIEEIMDWHKRFEGSSLSKQWYFWKIQGLAHDKRIKVMRPGGGELYIAALQDADGEEYPDIPF